LTLLRQEEVTWRQKSRINWLASGDRNTKFFHVFANARKQINTIWGITKEDGNVISSDQGLQLEAVDFFQQLYKAQPNLDITDQLAVLKNYPRMFSVEDSCRMFEPVTSAEIMSTLKRFKASKSPGLDGWTMDFFWLFMTFWVKSYWRWWKSPD
jgi:hypothetical protein